MFNYFQKSKDIDVSFTYGWGLITKNSLSCSFSTSKCSGVAEHGAW